MFHQIPPPSGLLDQMPDACRQSESISCAAVYEWTGNETLATSATWLIGKPLAILAIFIGAFVVRWLASKAIDRVVRRAEVACTPGGRSGPGAWARC